MNRVWPIRRVLVLTGAVFSLGAASASAAFHTHLEKSSPAADSTISTAPREVRLWFNEKVEAAVSTIALVDASGAKIAVAKVRADSADARQIVAGVTGTFKPGAYRIDWRTMGKDGHPVRGSFNFKLR